MYRTVTQPWVLYDRTATPVISVMGENIKKDTQLCLCLISDLIPLEQQACTTVQNLMHMGNTRLLPIVAMLHTEVP